MTRAVAFSVNRRYNRQGEVYTLACANRGVWVKNGYMLDKVFACVVVIIVLSLCMNGVIRLYTHLALPYMRKNRRRTK